MTCRPPTTVIDLPTASAFVCTSGANNSVLYDITTYDFIQVDDNEELCFLQNGSSVISFQFFSPAAAELRAG